MGNGLKLMRTGGVSRTIVCSVRLMVCFDIAGTMQYKPFRLNALGLNRATISGRFGAAFALFGTLCGKRATAGEISKVISQDRLAVMSVTD